MSYFIPPDTVILGCEHQRDEVVSLEVTFSGCGRKDSVAGTEGSIFEAEWGDL